jgi:hypothetical protein
MKVKIFVFDYLTHETIIDNTIEVASNDMDIVEKNHKAFRESYPDCQVNFMVDSDNFFFSPPLNMEKDEKELSYEAYMDKWHGGPQESDNDMPY